MVAKVSCLGWGQRRSLVDSHLYEGHKAPHLVGGGRHLLLPKGWEHLPTWPAGQGCDPSLLVKCPPWRTGRRQGDGKKWKKREILRAPAAVMSFWPWPLENLPTWKREHYLLSSSGLLCALQQATLPPDLDFSPLLSSSALSALIANPLGEGWLLPAFLENLSPWCLFFSC